MNKESGKLMKSSAEGRPAEKKGDKLQKGAKFYRNFNLATAGIWTGVGVVATGPVALAAFGMAAIDGVQAGISHKIAKSQEKKPTVVKTESGKKLHSGEVVVFDASAKQTSHKKNFALAA